MLLIIDLNSKYVYLKEQKKNPCKNVWMELF